MSAQEQSPEVAPPVTPDVATLEMAARALENNWSGGSAQEASAFIRSLASPAPESIKTKREEDVVERRALSAAKQVAADILAREPRPGVNTLIAIEPAIRAYLRAANLLASHAPAASPVQGVDATAWLIELKGDVPSYWTCEDWTPDVNRAIRFARAQDAQRVIDDFGWTEAVAVEHMWCEPRAATPQSPSTVDERVGEAFERSAQIAENHMGPGVSALEIATDIRRAALDASREK